MRGAEAAERLREQVRLLLAEKRSPDVAPVDEDRAPRAELVDVGAR